MFVACMVLAAGFATGAGGRAADTKPATSEGFEVSYTSGEHDAAGQFLGGTELRNLATYRGKLYAGNGYWEDRPGPEGKQPTQVLVLDGPAERWRVEHNFDEKLPDGRPRHLAISALEGVTFTTDGNGQKLAQPVSMLCAGTWDLSGLSQVFSRDDSTGRWTAMTLPGQRVTSGIQQVRALGFHADRQTGADHVFVGNNPYGIYRGSYDPAVPGRIGWTSKPELDLSTLAAPPSAGLTLPRVASFAECNGVLYATIGQQIYQRVDGALPSWRLLYTNPKPGHSETGLRGLTAIPNPAGPGQVLLTTVEGTVARVLRIDPASGNESAELDLQAYLSRAWNTRVGYVIAAYNDMTIVENAPGSGEVLFGIEAFLPAKMPVPDGHTRVDGLDGGGWFFVRHTEGNYDLRHIGTTHPVTGSPLVATRAIARSPFADDPDRIYFAGFDANKHPAHNTAWIFRTSKADALGRHQAQPPVGEP
jgi:hypothetical protein